MGKAIWKKVNIHLFGAGQPDPWGRWEKNVPTAETVAVWKPHCPKCNALCQRLDEMYYCPACGVHYDGVQEEK